MRRTVVNYIFELTHCLSNPMGNDAYTGSKAASLACKSQKCIQINYVHVKILKTCQKYLSWSNGQNFGQNALTVAYTFLNDLRVDL